MRQAAADRIAPGVSAVQEEGKSGGLFVTQTAYIPHYRPCEARTYDSQELSYLGKQELFLKVLQLHVFRAEVKPVVV